MSKRILSQIGKAAKPQKDAAQRAWDAFRHDSGLSREEFTWHQIHAALDAYNLRTGRGKARA